jgi:hypothetical protein
MNVLRGTFRLSIVVALVVAACYGISAHIAAHDAAWEDRKHWSTLRCGERFLGQDMSKYTSPYRPEVIDIGKAGCSNSSYWATFDEIRMALASADPRAIDIVRSSGPNCMMRFLSPWEPSWS